MESSICFCFDPKRQAILLVAGDKAGVSEKRFYKQLIQKADQRFDSHLRNLKNREKNNGKKTLRNFRKNTTRTPK